MKKSLRPGRQSLLALLHQGERNTQSAPCHRNREARCAAGHESVRMHAYLFHTLYQLLAIEQGLAACRFPLTKQQSIHL